jgi:hypothetical protein
MGSASACRPDRPERDRTAADPADAGGFPTGPEGRDRPIEGYGPLALERFEKGDGRALILYTRTEPESR